MSPLPHPPATPAPSFAARIAGSSKGRLPASRGSDDGGKPGTGDHGSELGGEMVSAVKQLGILFAERGQAAVRTRVPGQSRGPQFQHGLVGDQVGGSSYVSGLRRNGDSHDPAEGAVPDGCATETRPHGEAAVAIIIQLNPSGGLARQQEAGGPDPVVVAGGEAESPELMAPELA